MRVLPAVISVMCVAVSLDAIAGPKPKIAVAPLQGDPNGKIAEAVVDSLAGKDFVVVTPQEVRRELAKLRASGELDGKTTRKLAANLEVIAILDGKVGNAGRKRTLRLAIHRPGKRVARLRVEFASTSEAAFHRGVHDRVVDLLGGDVRPTGDDDGDDDASDPGDTDDTRNDDRAPPASRKTDDERTGALADADRKARDDERAISRRGSVASDDDDDDNGAPRRKARRRSASTAHAIARVGAGASVAQRQLTYSTRSGFTQVPPRVVTTAGSGRVDGEVYPFLLVDPHGALARLGIAASYDKTFGLSIKIPNLEVRAPIDQAHYAIGARYRLGIGKTSTIAFGLDYLRRRYIADRSSLMAVVLDAPDVDYMAVSPGASARVPVTPTITIIGALQAMLMIEAGPIQRTPSYGPATVYGLEAIAGVDVPITSQLGLRVALEYSRISLSFSGEGQMTTSRDNDVTTQDVNGATDRWLGVAATLGLIY